MLTRRDGLVGGDDVVLDAEEVVAVLSRPSWAYNDHPPTLPPWVMITPAAPDSGTVTSAVTECDLFFNVSTQFSVTRIPE